MAVAVVLSGCTGTPRPDATDSPGSTTSSPPTPGHSTGTFPAPLPSPTDDVASQDAALAAGSAAVTAFARPDLGADQWWTELSPLLSPAAAQAYAGTDPVEVPARQVTGPPRTGVSPSPFLATVFVPTDAGEYAVLMVREGSGAPWLVERITQVPPESSPAPRPPTAEAPTAEAGT